MQLRDRLSNCARDISVVDNATIHSSVEHGTASEDAIPTSFFVVGPPRTGTSWLHEVLDSYTNLPTPTKETRFFDLHFHRGANWYRAHFPELRPDRPSGEIAPTYFASDEARRRIAETVPGAKLVFIFRNPVQRVVSLYRIKRAYGMLPWTLDEALDRDPELIASGRYATNLKKWFDEFSRNQLLVTYYDDLRSSPQMFIDTISEFLEIPRICLADSHLKRVHSSDALTEPRFYLATRSATAVADWCKARRLDKVVAAVRKSVVMKFILGGGAPFPELSEKALHRLNETFLPEVEGLEQLTGRSFPGWKNTAVRTRAAS